MTTTLDVTMTADAGDGAGRPAGSPNAARLLAAARSLIPLIEADAEEIERNRDITPRVFQAIKDAELPWALIPEAAGGGGLRLSEFVQVIEQVSSADGSVGWCLHVWASGALNVALLPAEGTQFLFGGQDRKVTVGTAFPPGRATRVEGGIRVSGRLQWASGSTYADYVGIGYTLYDDDGSVVMVADGVPDMGMALVRHDEIEFVGNWNTSGLAGTSSVDVAVDDVFVPDHLVIRFAAEVARPEPLYKMGMMAISIPYHSGMILGMTRRALHEVSKLTDGKVRQGYPVPVGEFPVFQYEFAKHEAAYQAARAYVLSVVEDAQQFAEREGHVTSEHVSRIYQAATYAEQVGEQVIGFARYWAGSPAFREPSRLGRVFRDMAIAVQHVSVDPINLVNAAPDLLESWKTL
jgi:alkylation response protein AidB-like acyl-CoA dehydrogenase